MSRPQNYLRAVLFGIISITSYVVLFTYQEMVMEIISRGGFYAAVPVVIALYFSLIHGSFASNVIDALGLKAAGTRQGAEKESHLSTDTDL